MAPTVTLTLKNILPHSSMLLYPYIYIDCITYSLPKSSQIYCYFFLIDCIILNTLFWSKSMQCIFRILTTFRLFLFCRLLNEFPLMVLLSDPIGHVCRYGSKFLSPLNVEHLVVKVDVGFYFLQQGPLRSPGQEKSLVDLQAPASESLQDTSPGAGSTAGRDQEGSDGTVQTLILGVEFSLELPQSLQETF